MVKGQRYNIQPISYDDDLTVDGGRAAAERLVNQDKVKHVICQFNSPPIIGVLGVAEPNKVLQIGNGMTEKTMEPQYHYFYALPRCSSTMERRSITSIISRVSGWRKVS